VEVPDGRTRQAADQLGGVAVRRPSADIGPYVVEADAADELDILWDAPAGLASDPCSYRLRFRVESESGDAELDDRMFELWELYRRNHTAYLPTINDRLVSLFRGVTWGPWQPEYSPDWPADRILGLTRWATVEVRRTDSDDELTHDLRVSFRLAWDEEHGYSLPLDPEAGTFGKWED
jgi:hypothetical protein